ncbi:MAG: hypothetical protein R3F31_02165 [Verrucomicrobiales bacterium]
MNGLASLALRAGNARQAERRSLAKHADNLRGSPSSPKKFVLPSERKDFIETQPDYYYYLRIAPACQPIRGKLTSKEEP